MRHKITPFVVISAETSRWDKTQNAKCTAEMERMLIDEGLSFVKAEGRYFGSDEQSFIVFGDLWLDPTFREKIAGLHNYFMQDGVLAVNGDKTARLIGHRGKETFVGHWEEISADKAHAAASITKIGDRYFTVA